MKKITSVTSVTLITVILAGCSGPFNPGTDPRGDTGLPPIGVFTADNIITKARAEFDVKTNKDGQASFQLVKKSYAAGSCSHGTCTDFTDIQVTNTTSTQFSLTQTGTLYSPAATNNNLGVIATLNVGTLFDNDLFACGGNKCTSALTRIYTTNANAGAGLYNSKNGQSIPLLVTGPSVATPTAVPYLQANALILNTLSISNSQQVVSLTNNFFSTDSYPLSADFTTAGSGVYKAHVVVEYDLATSGGIFAAPLAPATRQIFASALGGATFAIMGDGTVKGVGRNNSGQTGSGTAGTDVSTPALVSGFAGAQSMSLGDYHGCAIMADGSVKCVGNGGAFGTSGSVINPYTVSGFNNAKALAAGPGNVFALMSDNSVAAIGNNQNGQFGDGTTNASSSSKAIPQWGSVKNLVAGGQFTCAILLSNGSVECSGYNSAGQFGNGTTTNVTAPTVISNWGTGVKAIFAGNLNLCAILSDNSAKCAGDNGYYQLGTTSVAQSSTPLAIPAYNSSSYIGIAPSSICALNSGTVKCSGNDYSPGIGDGGTGFLSTPITIANWSGATQLTVGQNYICAVMSDNSFKCQGNNSYGQLGDGTKTDRPTPIVPLF